MPCPHCGAKVGKHWSKNAPAPYAGKYTYVCGYSSASMLSPAFAIPCVTPCLAQSKDTELNPCSSICICSMVELMTSGCKCGAFQKEKLTNA
jgi:hypothetical protein